MSYDDVESVETKVGRQEALGQQNTHAGGEWGVRSNALVVCVEGKKPLGLHSWMGSSDLCGSNLVVTLSHTCEHLWYMWERWKGRKEELRIRGEARSGEKVGGEGRGNKGDIGVYIE